MTAWSALIKFFEIDNINNYNNNNISLGEWQVNNDDGLRQVKDAKFNNNKDKICLFLMKMRLVGYGLDQVLDYIIVNLMVTAL